MNVECIIVSQLKGKIEEKIIAISSNIRGIDKKYIPITKIKTIGYLKIDKTM